MRGIVILGILFACAWFFFGEELGLREVSDKPRSGQAATMQLHEQAEQREQQSQQQ